MSTAELVPVPVTELLRGDRIEDGGSTGLVVKSVRVTEHSTYITDIHGWRHHHYNDTVLDVRLPRQSGEHLLAGGQR